MSELYDSIRLTRSAATFTRALGVDAPEGADAVGINCSTGPDQLENIIQNLAGSLSVPVIAKPNAGMPTINDQGIAVYDMTPEYFGKSMKRLVDLGASMVGGCCGTDPSYIKALVNAIR